MSAIRIGSDPAGWVADVVVGKHRRSCDHFATEKEARDWAEAKHREIVETWGADGEGIPGPPPKRVTVGKPVVFTHPKPPPLSAIGELNGLLELSRMRNSELVQKYHVARQDRARAKRAAEASRLHELACIAECEQLRKERDQAFRDRDAAQAHAYRLERKS